MHRGKQTAIILLWVVYVIGKHGCVAATACEDEANEWVVVVGLPVARMDPSFLD